MLQAVKAQISCGQLLFGRAAFRQVRLDWPLWRRVGLGSSIWQEDQNEKWEEDGVCPEGQEEAPDT